MPSRSVLLASILAALALPAGAAAKVVVIDRAGHVVATPVRTNHSPPVLGWTADGAGLVLGRGEGEDGVERLDVATGARTSLGDRPGLLAVGPGDRWVAAEGQTIDLATITVHAADGTVLATTRLPQGLPGGAPVAEASWSADGGRVALNSGGEVVVLDLATGRELRRARTAAAVGHLLSPDGGTLLVPGDEALQRVDVATGAAQTLTARAARRGAPPIGQFSASGRLAVFVGHRAWLDGAPGPITLPETLQVAQLAPDGAAVVGLLGLPAAAPCGPQRGRVVAYAPGAAPVTLVPAFAGDVLDVVWSPDGTRAAVHEQPVDPADYGPERRGTRHPWPKRPIAKDYEMFSARGDRAVRRAVVRFAADLRAGLSREHALVRLGAALDRIGGEVWDTTVTDAIATAIDPWLHAAGFRGIDAVDELEDGC